MKRQIRRNCFETNSSSTHAICITKKDVNSSLLPSSILFTYGEFGWENKTYSSVRSKAAYLYQAIDDCYSDDEKEGLIYKLKEILEKNGITYYFDSDWSGYIDHPYGTTEFVEAVLSDEDKLLRYLFGDSFIITGNDNDGVYWDEMEKHRTELVNYEVYEKSN